MNKITDYEQLRRELSYTSEEWKTHTKVEKSCWLDDLDTVLQAYDKDINTLSKEQLNTILNKYDKMLCYEWTDIMQDAITMVMGKNYLEEEEK